jgi:hypothetical protein
MDGFLEHHVCVIVSHSSKVVSNMPQPFGICRGLLDPGMPIGRNNA